MKVEVKTFASATDHIQVDALIDTYRKTFACIQNMRWVHWNAKGRKFDRIHSLAEEYYHRINDDFDFIAELCLQHAVNLIHPLQINVENLVVNEPIDIEYGNAIEVMRSILQTMLDSLNALSNSLEGHRGDQSKLDDMIAYYDKEINYKMDRRL